MLVVPKIFLQRDGLTPNQNIVYRNFNILLVIAIADISVILFSLKDLEQRWPFRICLIELCCFIVFIFLHLKGLLSLVRYFTFLVALVMQATACVIHGKTAGFDFVFYALAVLPTLFFEKKRHYISLFLISIVTMLTIHYVYSLFEPMVIMEGFVYYWNIFFTAALVMLVMYTFKSGYERQQKQLLDQHRMMVHQKEEIEGINNNLELILVDRTEKIKDQATRIRQAAFINAHKVRSPLARIIGLLNIVELEENKVVALEDYLPVLKSNAEELNEMLREMSITLSDLGNEKAHGHQV